ncbi:excinuclease ABC subunit UvrC [Natranaerofaba carboxydovora]|uniref:excinuclease ABC subunit UvrC n=1 Tax=Natranaerofaba carboxydovora TaxID=2742683 RepID=UPI001F144F5D|nr:excinuclease ABC subunit UvrC [Natranaerofaba carboxydovora]UMZ72643.1 UvrABC system protein C [Natranaerofaba carboxydovora]
MELQDKLGTLPDKPGVYLMKNEADKVIYVGKAINLKNRVRSYFGSNQTIKERVLVPKIADIETIVTDSELEALILESNLIKRYRPKYNINLKDDKNYPYLKISTEEDYPRLLLEREIKKEGKYFGPYPNAGAVRETIKLLRKLFPIRSCKKEVPNKKYRPCLNYHIKRCIAPCSGKVPKEKYREMIDNIIMVLEGKEDELIDELQQKMDEASTNLEFEKAAEYRNQQNALKRIVEKQKIISGRRDDQDYLAISSNNEKEAIVQIFYVRGGKLVGKDSFSVLPGKADSPGEILTGFVKQYYNQAAVIPGEIFISHPIGDHSIIESWLKEKRGAKVTIKVPKRGEKYQLMKMALNNAKLEVEKIRADEEREEKEEKMTGGALKELAGYLELEELPVRIECYDISHIRGRETVASMVVFENGRPKKEDYRRFKLRDVIGIDDYDSMREVLSRRLKRLKRERTDEEDIDSFDIVPDLIVIDGGKGQLNAAYGELEEHGFSSNITVISLAKEEEKVFVTGKKDPVKLPKNSEAQYLLQRIRDEAHRFAVTYHRKKRNKSGLSSELDDVKGVGPKRKKALLLNFGSLDKLKEASLEELEKVPAMDKKSAQNLYDYFHKKEQGLSDE